MDHGSIDSRTGFAQVAFAHVLWGILPLYWSLLNHVPSIEVMMNRILWTGLFSAGYFLLKGKNPIRIALETFRTSRVWLLVASALFIALNWIVFLYTISLGHLLQASMAYFISPLLLVLFAMIFFKEKMGKLQAVALSLCLIGVVYTGVMGGEIPYFSLIIALTFAAYTICKKALRLDGIQALLMDGLIIMPVSLSFVTYLLVTGQSSYSLNDIPTTSLLILGGIVTIIPLVLYIRGNMSVSATTVGFLQFILPVMAFLLGIFVFDEPFKVHDAITFSCILAGVTLYLISLRKKTVLKELPV